MKHSLSSLNIQNWQKQTVWWWWSCLMGNLELSLESINKETLMMSSPSTTFTNTLVQATVQHCYTNPRSSSSRPAEEVTLSDTTATDLYIRLTCSLNICHFFFSGERISNSEWLCKPSCGLWHCVQVCCWRSHRCWWLLPFSQGKRFHFSALLHPWYVKFKSELQGPQWLIRIQNWEMKQQGALMLYIVFLAHRTQEIKNGRKTGEASLDIQHEASC